MPPFVALILCLLFIAWLLFVDFRQRTVSAAVWLPTMLLLILGSRPVSAWFNGGISLSAGGEVEGSPLDRIFYFSIIAGSLAVASARGVKWGRLLAANRAITIFYLYFAVSVLWSGDPSGSFKRIFKDFGSVFVISVLLSEKDPFEAMRAVYVRCAYILIPLSALFIKYYPNLGRAYTIAGVPMSTGVTMQKNSLGEIVLVFGLFVVWDYIESRSRTDGARQSRFPLTLCVLLLMSAWLLQLSESKTATMCLTVGTVLIVRGKWLASATLNRAILLGAMMLPPMLFFAQQFNSLIAPLIAALGRDMTFTGRTEIWESVTLSTVNPILGSGYWNFWGGPGGLAIRRAMKTPGLFSGHNGYLDIYLDGGAVGLTLAMLLIWFSGRRILARFGKDRFQHVRFAVLVVAILYNMSESTLARLVPIWFTVLLVMLDFPPLTGGVAAAPTPAVAPKDTPAVVTFKLVTAASKRAAFGPVPLESKRW